MEKPLGVPLEFDNKLTESVQGQILSFDAIPDILSMDIPPIEWLVDGLIARKTLTLWTGTDGTAKTFLVQRMAVAIATGNHFLGRRTLAAPVLYVDFENPSFVVRERLELMTGGPIRNFKVWGTWLAQQPPLIGNDLLLRIAKETQPLMIFDPFKYGHTADENSATEMTPVMQFLRACAAAGSAVVVVHHVAKSEGSLGRGSTVIKGAVDVAFLQELNPETGLITLTCSKNRFGERHNVTVRPDFEEGTFEVVDSPKFSARQAEMEKLRQIISSQAGLSQNAIFKMAGMRKARLVELLKAGKGSQWQERKVGSALLYFSLRSAVVDVVPDSTEQLGTAGTGEGREGLFPCSHPYKGTRNNPPVTPPPSSGNCREQIRENPKTLTACPACQSTAIYPMPDGKVECQTCGHKWRKQ